MTEKEPILQLPISLCDAARALAYGQLQYSFYQDRTFDPFMVRRELWNLTQGKYEWITEEKYQQEMSNVLRWRKEMGKSYQELVSFTGWILQKLYASHEEEIDSVGPAGFDIEYIRLKDKQLAALPEAEKARRGELGDKAAEFISKHSKPISEAEYAQYLENYSKRKESQAASGL